MTEATYKRKDLFGLMVQEGWESLMAYNRLERKLRAHVFNCKQEARARTRNGQVPSVTLPLTRPHILRRPRRHQQPETK